MNFTTIEIIEFTIILLLMVLIFFNRKWTIKETKELKKDIESLKEENFKYRKQIHFLLDLFDTPPVSIVRGTIHKKEAYEVKQDGRTSNKVKVDGKWTKMPGDIYFYSNNKGVYISLENLSMANGINPFDEIEKLHIKGIIL